MKSILNVKIPILSYPENIAVDLVVFDSVKIDQRVTKEAVYLNYQTELITDERYMCSYDSEDEMVAAHNLLVAAFCKVHMMDKKHFFDYHRSGLLNFSFEVIK